MNKLIRSFFPSPLSLNYVDNVIDQLQLLTTIISIISVILNMQI